jgi:excisionase family DNA binding protein
MSLIDISSPAAEEPLLINAEELARLINVSKRTLWRLRSAGDLPAPVRLGSTVRWRLDEIRAWIGQGCPSCKPPALGRKRA